MGTTKSIGKPKSRPVLICTVILLTIATVAIAIIILTTDTPTLSNFNAQINRYVFVLGLAAVFLLEMFAPIIAEKVFKVKIALAIIFLYYAYCFGGTFLGSVANMYYIIPSYDRIMHFTMGVNTSMIGLALVQYFWKDKGYERSPVFVAVIMLFSGIALCTVWEVFEFTIDYFFELNSQGYAVFETGELLVGQAALMDTMSDTLFNIAGALVIAIPMCISIKYNKSWHVYCTIKTD